jgi:hypothetical protein
MGSVDLWSLITVVANNNQRVEDLFSIVEELPPDKKAELVQRLLKSNDLNVTFGNNQLSGTIIVQINTMDQAALSDILQAIASRITSEPPREEELPSESSQSPSDNSDN